jgi:tetratricopeptide (TPR) repeat protein
MEIQRKALGDRHPNVATSLNSLSRVLVRQQRYDEAVKALKDALDIARPVLGDDHQLIAIYSINLGSAYLARNEPGQAEAPLREGLRIRLLAADLVPARRRTYPEDDWSPGATRSLLGAALTVLGRYDEAETMLLDARRDLEAMPVPPERELKQTLARLDRLYEAWGRPNRP